MTILRDLHEILPRNGKILEISRDVKSSFKEKSLSKLATILCYNFPSRCDCRELYRAVFIDLCRISDALPSNGHLLYALVGFLVKAAVER